MKIQLILLIFVLNNVYSANEGLKFKKSVKQMIRNKTKVQEKKPPESTPFIIVPKKTTAPKLISPETIKQWAKLISDQLHYTENAVVRTPTLLKSFNDIKTEFRNGRTIVDRMAAEVEDLLIRRAEAAHKIMRSAEETVKLNASVPDDYLYDNSVDIDVLKPKPSPPSPDDIELESTCLNTGKVALTPSKHFNASVNLEKTSVQVSAEVFDCDPYVKQQTYWTENLVHIFRENYAQDATMDFQYFCNVKGAMRHYPAASWQSMHNSELDPEQTDPFDCRLRPWYVSAGGAPRDVLIMVDASGSMNNSINTVVAKTFVQTLLNTLSDDDQVNLLRYNVITESPIKCFNDKLVPANHINTAAIMSMFSDYPEKNETKMELVLEDAVNMLQRQYIDTNRTAPCQQAIVLLTDSLYKSYDDLLSHLDPQGRIRLFTLWLHDPFGLREDTLEHASNIACERDGYFAELTTNNDVTEQVMNILRVMERPLVKQRKERLTVYSDVYAHLEDPRRGEYLWSVKDKAEQLYRYKELRRDKAGLLNSSRMTKDYDHQLSLQEKGHYYEEETVNYRLTITVSVPVFDPATKEDIVKMVDLDRAKPEWRTATRTYPVNRLLGVVGVDVPIDHLKLLLPYYELGAGGYLYIIDHRGNTVIHENLKTTFDGNILRPGYRTVDMIDLEQPAAHHAPRHYPKEWLKFRNQLLIDEEFGNRTLAVKYVLDGGLRAYLETRTYYWRRISGHYTGVVVLPFYNRLKVVDGKFTQKLAEDAYKALDGTDYVIQPQWLYCQYINLDFDNPKKELIHFLQRRRDQPNFDAKNVKHLFLPPSMTLTKSQQTYQCNEKLMAGLCNDAILTTQWREEQEKYSKTDSQIGSVTAFFVTEHGLMRWQKYFDTSAHADPPDGSEWPKGPMETFYRRAAASPNKLIIHAPVQPHRKFRNVFIPPPAAEVRDQWLTAARALVVPNDKMVGVAGFHFYPRHLSETVEKITKPSMECDDPLECDPQCDGENWSCILVDEGGWIVATSVPDTEDYDDPIRKHLATSYPAAMDHLLTTGVFQLHWVHDYQAVCFTPEDNSATMLIPNLLRAAFKMVSILMHATQQIVYLITAFSMVGQVYSETSIEKEKRRRALKLWINQDRFEQLFDKHVLINKTTYAACDRSRPFYELLVSKVAEVLHRPAHACTRPLVGSMVPGTNLLLLAIYNLCPNTSPRVRDPLNNVPLDLTKDNPESQGKESDLACLRSSIPMPVRPPNLTCFQHNYMDEVEYRQCGPWIADPKPEGD